MNFEMKILDLLKAKSLSVGSWAVILALVTAVVRLTQPDATTHFALVADLFTLPAIPWPCRMALLLIMVACAFSRSEPVQSAQVALLRVVNGCKVRNLHNAFFGGKCLKCHRVLLGAASLVPVHRVPFPTVSRVLLVVLAFKKSISPPDELKAAVGLKTILSDNSLWWILLLILECVYVLFNDGNKSWHSIVDNEDTSRLFLTRAPLRCSRPRAATIYCRKPSLLLQLVCGFGIPLFIEIYALSTYHSAMEFRVSSLCQQMLCSSVLPIMFLLINSPQTPLLPNQRFLASAALSSLWAAIRIASIHHATTSISFATSFWVLLWYYLWPCMLVGVVGLSVPLLFLPSAQPDQGMEPQGELNLARCCNCLSRSLFIQLTISALMGVWSYNASLRVASALSHHLESTGISRGCHGEWAEEALIWLLLIAVLFLFLATTEYLVSVLHRVPAPLLQLQQLDWSSPKTITRLDEVKLSLIG